MILMDVLGVRLEMPSKQPLVLLKESDGLRYVPIWIGAVEATAIAQAHQGIVGTRPQTHELTTSIITALGDELTGVFITAVSDGVFFAELSFASGVVVEARPSDSIALALRCGAQVWCAEEVLRDAGITEDSDADAEVERFREFLDEVDPADFEE